MSLRIAKALALRSTLSKIWGLLNLEVDEPPEPLEVDADEAEAAADAKPSKESTSDATPGLPSGFCEADAASSASAA